MKQQELEKVKEYKYGFTTEIESIKAPKDLMRMLLNLYLISKKNLSGC